MSTINRRRRRDDDDTGALRDPRCAVEHAIDQEKKLAARSSTVFQAGDSRHRISASHQARSELGRVTPRDGPERSGWASTNNNLNATPQQHRRPIGEERPSWRNSRICALSLRGYGNAPTYPSVDTAKFLSPSAFSASVFSLQRWSRQMK